MRVYFLRHGIAVERTEWSEADTERPLTTKGRKRVARLAKALIPRGLTPDKVICSPCLRTKQTAEIMLRLLPAGVPLAIDERLAPGFHFEQLARLLVEQERFCHLMLVGHEPDFGELIGAMIGGGRIALKKGAVACLDVSPSQPNAAKLCWMVTPKLFR